MKKVNAAGSYNFSDPEGENMVTTNYTFDKRGNEDIAYYLDVLAQMDDEK
ncbi:MAG: hypothetical protein LBT22_02825 [Peptococcaceae bacterium]|jgi:hypothetical protein|nr:hypothetical protein [Peptococcaceae bacterium]